MADRSTGPVKPPVIDLTARSGARSEDEPRAADGPEAAALPPRRGDWLGLGAAALAGAVLGTALTYGLAASLPLPGRAPDLTGDLAAQSARIDALSDALDAQKATGTKTQVSLDATIAQLDAAQKHFDEALAGLGSSLPAPTDLAPLEAEIKALKTQLDAVAAGASGADAGAIGKSLADLDGNVASLTTRLNGVDAAMATLRSDIDATRRSLADHVNAAGPGETGPAMKLPLILSGLEGAFATGKPFASELAALDAVLPGTAVPDDLRAAAIRGLSRPDTLMQEFEAALPEILAARSTGTGDWTSNVADWTRSLLALRPATEQQGNDPEAVISRLEAAMARRDYAAAAGLVALLPAPMQAAARPIAGDIAVHAAADQLVADLRTRALAATEAAP